MSAGNIDDGDDGTSFSRLREKKMREDEVRASSPETDPSDLIWLARFYPDEVEKNPALELILVGDPDAYHQIQERLGWARHPRNVLPPKKEEPQ